MVKRRKVTFKTDKGEYTFLARVKKGKKQNEVIKDNILKEKRLEWIGTFKKSSIKIEVIRMEDEELYGFCEFIDAKLGEFRKIILDLNTSIEKLQDEVNKVSEKHLWEVKINDWQTKEPTEGGCP